MLKNIFKPSRQILLKLLTQFLKHPPPLNKEFEDEIPKVLGRISLVEHTVPMDDFFPIRITHYRLAYSTQLILREEVNILMQQVIVKF